MIVADLLHQHIFPDFRLVAGNEGLTREITAISVIDAPDMASWLKGGEFLFGTGYIFKDSQSALSLFFHEVAGRGIAAMGLKLDRYHAKFPETLLQEANELKIPVFEIPFHYRWSDIIHEIQSRLYHQDQERLGQSRYAPPLLWSSDWDSKRLISTLATEIQKEILVEIHTLQMKYGFAPDGSPIESDRFNEVKTAFAVREIELPRKGNIYISLEEKEVQEGKLWTANYSLKTETPITLTLILNKEENHPSLRDERLVLRAISLLRSEALELALASNQLSAKRERFLENLCLGSYQNQDMAAQRAKNLGVSIPFPCQVFGVATMERITLPLWMPPYENRYALGNFWVVIESSKKLEQDAETLHEIARDNHLWIAMGSVADDFPGIQRSYEETKKALYWIRDFKPRPGLYRFSDLALHALLGRLSRMPESEGLWKRFWMPLKTIDSSRRAIPLEDVLNSLILCDFNAKKSADLLHIHYNTARNYLREIEELLRVDLNNRLHRLALSLAHQIEIAKSKES